MGRLIDAYRLQKQFNEKSTNPNYRVNMHNIKSIISNAPTVEAIPKDQYETRLKADMVAMLTEIQLEIEELDVSDVVPEYQDGAEESREYIANLIQQKIDALKGEQEAADDKK